MNVLGEGSEALPVITIKDVTIIKVIHRFTLLSLCTEIDKRIWKASDNTHMFHQTRMAKHRATAKAVYNACVINTLL